MSWGRSSGLGGEGAGGGREAARRLLGVCTEAGAAAAPPRSPWTGFIARGSSRRCRAASVSPHVGSRPSPAPCASPPRVQRPRPGAGPRGQLPSWPDVPFEKAGTSGEGFKERVRGVGSGPCWESTKQLRAGPAESSGHPGVPPIELGWEERGLGTPNSNLEKQPPRRVTTGTAPPLGRASLVGKCSGRRERVESWRERKAQVWIDPLGRNGKCLPPRGRGQSSELCLGEGDYVRFQPQSCLRDRSRRSGPCPLRPL